MDRRPSRQKTSPVARTIRLMYERLYEAYGPQNWWPAETTTEVVVGAILTQNTAWANVQRAIENLKRADCLSWVSLRDVSQERLAGLVQPSGTYRVKALRLKSFVEYLWERHGGSLESLLGGDPNEARERLLSITGVGPETADAILLYAGGRLTFVVDAYTKRVLRRHELISESASYDDVRRLFHQSLDPDLHFFNEFHALLVTVGKKHCRVRARCDGCPLMGLPGRRTV